MRRAPSNCQAILVEAGAALEDVVEVGILLTDPADFAGMNDEYSTWFPAELPARYVAKLGVEIPGLLASIRMTALVGWGRCLTVVSWQSPIASATQRRSRRASRRAGDRREPRRYSPRHGATVRRAIGYQSRGAISSSTSASANPYARAMKAKSIPMQSRAMVSISLPASSKDS